MTLNLFAYAYLAVSIGLTAWVARTLYSNGASFLIDCFAGNAELAGSVNRLLVVGFYLVNLGFACLGLRTGELVTLDEGVEVLAAKVGRVMLVLGAMHFFNLYIFSRIRRRTLMASAPPPLPPDGYLAAA